MSDAFQCERCGEYKDGVGNRLHVKEDHSKRYPVNMELCESCYTQAVGLVREYVEVDESNV
jgi:hypothetical protein